MLHAPESTVDGDSGSLPAGSGPLERCEELSHTTLGEQEAAELLVSRFQGRDRGHPLASGAAEIGQVFDLLQLDVGMVAEESRE